MNHKGKLLIVGASAYQHYIYKTAKQNDIWIGSVDADANAPMFSESDKYWNIDFSDTEAVIKAVKPEGIDAVATINIDQGMKYVEMIKRGLGLPYTHPKQITTATRKDLMRAKWKERGIMQPELFVYNEQEKNKAKKLISTSDKFIVKPVDNSAKRGINVVEGSMMDIEDKIEQAYNYSKIKKIIVEEYIEGTLLFAATYIKEDKNIVTLMRQTINDSLVQIKFDAPVKLDKAVETKIKNEAVKAAKCFGNGPFHTEIIIDKDNVPYLIETSPRISYATVSLSRLTEGFDPVSQLLEDSCSFNVNNHSSRERYYSSLIHIVPPAGAVYDNSNINKINYPFLEEIVPVVKDGHLVEPFETNEHRVLYFTVFGKDPASVNKYAKIVNDQLLQSFIF